MEKNIEIEENKPKSVIIDGRLHTKFKTFCKNKCIKIGGIIEDLMLLYLSDSKGVQRQIDEFKEKRSN